MKDGKIINLSDYALFINHMSTLKDISEDESKKSVSYMTGSMRPAIDFDAVKMDYVKLLHLQNVPESNDAIFHIDNGDLVFVEFKNGIIDKNTTYRIRKKIYDSVLVFCDITTKCITDLRGHMEYILVYNEQKNKESYIVSKDEEDEKSKISSFSSFDKIVETINDYANEECVKFGVNIFKNYCFKSVHTYTEKEFEEYLKKNYSLHI